MKSIVLFGGGGHAKVIADAIEKKGECVIAGIVNPKSTLGEIWFNKYKIISFDDALKIGAGVVAIGDSRDRQSQVEKILSANSHFSFSTIIHPEAIIAREAHIDAGTVVMAGAIINSSAVVGKHAVINTGAVIEHDCKLGDYTFIGPKAAIAGNVQIEASSFIGMGALVKQGLKIGRNVLVGMGSVVLSNLPDNVTALGTPAKVCKKRNEGDRFFT